MRKTKSIALIVGDLHINGFQSILNAKTEDVLIKDGDKIKPVIDEYCAIRRKRREFERKGRINKLKIR